MLTLLLHCWLVAQWSTWISQANMHHRRNDGTELDCTPSSAMTVQQRCCGACKGLVGGRSVGCFSIVIPLNGALLKSTPISSLTLNARVAALESGCR